MEAKGPPGPEELKLLEPLRGKVPDDVFGEPYVPPVSRRLGQRPRAAEARQRSAARGRLQARRRRAQTAERQAVHDRVPRFLRRRCSRIPTPFQQNLRKLGIDAHSRIVDSGAVQEPHRQLRLRHRHRARSAAALTPGAELRAFSSAPRRRRRQGSRNLAGVADPAVDALIEKIANAERATSSTSPAARSTACCAPAHYWVPMWYQRRRLGRLLGRVLAPGAPAQARRRRAGHLVVGRRQGEENWVVRCGSRRVGNGESRRQRLAVPADSPIRRLPIARLPEPMLAYILRRLLLMIPTVFGIMLVSFAIVQFVPGGPVERAIAQLQGADQGSTARIRRRRRPDRRRRDGARRRRHFLALSRRAGARPEIHQGAGEAIRLRQAGAGALLDAGARLCDLQSRQELLPRRAGRRADQGEAAGLDVARPVDDADLLRDLDPARHAQGGQATARASTSGPRRWSSSATRSRASCSPSCWWCCSAAARSGRSFRCAA